MVNVRPVPNGNVFFFDENAHRRRRPRQPGVLLAYPTTPGEQGQYVYLYGPGLWTADLGLAKTFSLPGAARINFEALFINAFNHRNVVVGGTGGATLSASTRRRSARRRPPRSAARQMQFRLGFYF